MHCRISQALVERELGDKKKGVQELSALIQGPDRNMIDTIDWARIATAQISEHDLAGAERSIAEGQKMASYKNDIPEPSIALRIAAAQLDLARGKQIAAAEELQKARAQADRYGYAPLATQAQTSLEANRN